MTRIARAAVALAAAAAVTLSGSPAEAAAPHMRTFTLHDRGRHISLLDHHKIKLDLRTDSDGGYSWTVVKHQNFTLVRKASRPYKHKKGTVGYPTHSIYVFRATKVGAGSVLRLVEYGPGGTSEVGRHFTLTVRIH